MPPSQLAMTPDLAPIYDDGEMTLYEVKGGIQFPILAPSDVQSDALWQQQVEPYGRKPWITSEDVRVQLTWTLSNLDQEGHVVELLVDPWNEFGRYWPGLTLVDPDEGEYQPNFSGIDTYYELSGVGAGEASRRHGTYTYDDLQELAVDFATVINLIANPPVGGLGADEDGNALPAYVNHTFQNHSESDLLVRPYIPGTIPGLTGVDIGLRTREPATLAIEVVVELVDRSEDADRVREDDSNDEILYPSGTIVTIGTAP
ncbi:MAG TPA: hypothetical protein VM686_18750 [Polyangiaceae bacterium]|nr:hypothetical protein [Polyangiaceae bacterium]